MENQSLIEKNGFREQYILVAEEQHKRVYAHTVYYEVEEIDYEQFITENDDPVDNIFSEIQQRFLINALQANEWTKRDFWASSNVAIYHKVGQPCVVPDMFLSFDVKKPDDWFEKKDKCYFSWIVGKSPELVVEIISNKIGNENETKMKIYAEMGVLYYILVDPYLHLYKEQLNVFCLIEGKYEEVKEPHFYMEEVNLGITLWKGFFEKTKADWVRWCNKEGDLLLTGVERSFEEQKRADEQEKRAKEQEELAKEHKERNEKLLNHLKALGINIEELPI
jgi:Uma2 family endonuclease